MLTSKFVGEEMDLAWDFRVDMSVCGRTDERSEGF